MSHIHIPDGVLPLWLIAAGWLLAALAVGVAVYRLRGDATRRVPVLGVMAAVMLVGMSTEVVPIAYHVNLSVLTGIVVGPAYGLLAAFIVNLILAMFGHGGITVVGLNTLVIGAEAALGHYLFRALRAGLMRLLGATRRSAGGAPSPGLAAGLATVLALFVSTWLLIGIVWVSGADPGRARDTGALDPATLTFRNPFDAGLVGNRVVAPEREEPAQGAPTRSVNVVRFAEVVLVLGLVGWVLEAVVTGAIVAFVDRVRPDLIYGWRPGRTRPLG